MSAPRVRVIAPPLFASRRTTSSTSGEPATPAPVFSTTKKRWRMLVADLQSQGTMSVYSITATRRTHAARGTHGQHQAVRTRLRELDAQGAGPRAGREGPHPQAREDGGEPILLPARHLLALGRNHP